MGVSYSQQIDKPVVSSQERVEKDTLFNLNYKLEQKLPYASTKFQTSECPVCRDKEKVPDSEQRLSAFATTCGMVCNLTEMIQKRVLRGSPKGIYGATTDVHRLGNSMLLDTSLLHDKIVNWIGKCIHYYAVYVSFMDRYSTSTDIKEFFQFTDSEFEMFCLIVSTCQSRLSFLDDMSRKEFILFFPDIDAIEETYSGKDKGIGYLGEWGRSRIHYKRFIDYWIIFIDDKRPGKVVVLQFEKYLDRKDQNTNIQRNEFEYKVVPKYTKRCPEKRWILEGIEGPFASLKQLISYYKSVMRKSSDKDQKHKVIGRTKLKNVIV